MEERTFYEKKIKTFSQNVVTMLANLSFLAIWMLAQYGIFYLSSNYSTNDKMNENTVIVIRVLFAIGTVIPIIINMYRDISIMIIQANKEIQNEKD